MKERYVCRVIRSAKAMAEKSRARDRGLDRYVETLSRFLWPCRESWLLAVVGSVFILDYASTYAALELSGNTYIYENGPLAGWALKTGGFTLLFLVDMIAAGALSLAALTSRYLYLRFGEATGVLLL